MSKRLFLVSVLLTAVIATIIIPTKITHGHGGGLDANGCHHDRKRGGYHCHRSTAPVRKKYRKPSLPRNATDDAIREALISNSIQSYSGRCPCPYSRDRAGRRCGGRSAYSRPGGAEPLCYLSDIPKSMLDKYRTRQ